MFNRKPILIRGVLYPSRTAASLALGMHPRAVSVAISRGDDVQRVGLGDARHNGSKTPTTIHGVTYPSRAAAARAYGVSDRVIIGRAYRGTLDRLPPLKKTQTA